MIRTKKRGRIHRIALVCAFVLLSASILSAQTATGRIGGRVTDPTGAVSVVSGIEKGRRLPTVPKFQLATAATYQWEVKAAVLAAYDGVLRIKAGKLFTEPDPRGGDDATAEFLGELAQRNGWDVAETLGILLAAVLRAALTQALGGHTEARKALTSLLK